MENTKINQPVGELLNSKWVKEKEWRKLLDEQLFESVPYGIAVIDENYEIVEHNGHFSDIFGQGVGKHCYEAYKGRTSRCENCASGRVFEDGEKHVNEEVGKDRYGCDAFYITHAVPLVAEDGSIPYVMQICMDMTEARQRQREYKTLFDVVPCVIAVLNRDMRIVRANELFRDSFGETNGQRCYEKLRKRTEPCDECPIMNTFRNGGMYHKKYHCFHKDGKQAKYLVTSSPMSKDNPDSQYAVMMAIDITESEELARDLAETAISREVIIEDSIDAIWGTDENGTITLINPAAEVLLGYAAGDVIGKKTPKDMFPPEFMETVKNTKRHCILHETTMTARDGERIPVRFVCSAITRAKKLLGYSIFAQDLRTVKKLEADMMETERLAAVGQTVAGVAHSVKNILSGLEGGMYVFKTGMEKGENERITEGWDMIEKNIGHVTNLTRFLLDFAKHRKARVELTNPAEVVEEVVDLYRSFAWEADIELRADAADGIKDAFMDKQGLHTCLANLVTNSMDACRESVKPLCRVIVSCREEDNDLVFEVSDEGCGMDYEVRKQAFTRLFTTKRDSGTGLGLFMTRKIVQEHGGRIEMKSKPEEGATFKLIFPRDRLPEPTNNSGSNPSLSDNSPVAPSNANGNPPKESEND